MQAAQAPVTWVCECSMSAPQMYGCWRTWHRLARSPCGGLSSIRADICEALGEVPCTPEGCGCTILPGRRGDPLRGEAEAGS